MVCLYGILSAFHHPPSTILVYFYSIRPMFSHQSQNLDAFCLVADMLISGYNINGFFVFNIFPLTRSFGDCRLSVFLYRCLRT